MVDQDVVAWGNDDEVPRSRFAALLDQPFLTDPRAPLWTACGGGALVVASLMTDWATIQPVSTSGSRTPAADEFGLGIAGLGAWSASYLVGVLVLGMLAAITLFGDGRTAPGAQRQLDLPRRYARVAGLGVAAGLFALLLALAAAIGDGSVLARTSGTTAVPELSYGPGPFLALIGVAAAAAGLYLLDRPPHGGYETEATERAPAARPPVRQPRRPVAPRPARNTVDLTVTQVAPFAYLPEHTRQR